MAKPSVAAAAARTNPISNPEPNQQHQDVQGWFSASMTFQLFSIDIILKCRRVIEFWASALHQLLWSLGDQVGALFSLPTDAVRPCM